MKNRLINLFEQHCLCRSDVLECSAGKEIAECSDCLATWLIENGVIVPPCKVGDNIYQTDGVRIYESSIGEVTYTFKKVIYVTENVVFDEDAIGKTVFLSREEAEQALKGGEG